MKNGMFATFWECVARNSGILGNKFWELGKSVDMDIRNGGV